MEALGLILSPQAGMGGPVQGSHTTSQGSKLLLTSSAPPLLLSSQPLRTPPILHSDRDSPLRRWGWCGCREVVLLLLGGWSEHYRPVTLFLKHSP